jgi:hypothetical protein
VNVIDLIIKLLTLTATLYLNGREEDNGNEGGSSGSGAVIQPQGKSDNDSGVFANVSDSMQSVDVDDHASRAQDLDLIVWTGVSTSANIVLIVLALWIRFANLYLHWGALATWFILFLQGKDDFTRSCSRVH